MDPNELRTTMRRQAELLIEMNCSNCFAELLAESVLAMDAWLSRGGFLPAAWQSAVKPTVTGRVVESTVPFWFSSGDD